MKKYKIIYCDPPWSYYNDKTIGPDCTTVKGMRRPPYPVMSVADIKALNVKDISENDSIIFMWTSDYHLASAIEIMKEWGFTYKTIAFSWLKLNKQNKPVSFMGAYTMKSGIEICLLGTRGNHAHKLVKKHNIKSLVQSQREEHSKKPAEVRDRIVELIGDIPRVELFARQKIEGWDIWGNELHNDLML